MADYTITPAEVLVLVPSASVDLLNVFIPMLAAADACLEGQGIADASGKALKRLAAAHMATITLNGGRGVVTSESVPAASRSFASWRGKEGLSMSPFGDMLKGLDTTGCVTGLFDADGTARGPQLFIGTAGT